MTSPRRSCCRGGAERANRRSRRGAHRSHIFRRVFLDGDGDAADEAPPRRHQHDCGPPRRTASAGSISRARRACRRSHRFVEGVSRRRGARRTLARDGVGALRSGRRAPPRQAEGRVRSIFSEGRSAASEVTGPIASRRGPTPCEWLPDEQATTAPGNAALSTCDTCCGAAELKAPTRCRFSACSKHAPQTSAFSVGCSIAVAKASVPDARRASRIIANVGSCGPCRTLGAMRWQFTAADERHLFQAWRAWVACSSFRSSGQSSEGRCAGEIVRSRPLCWRCRPAREARRASSMRVRSHPER